MESILNKYLQGTDSSESVANFMDTLTGKSKKGGDVQLTLQNSVQQAAIKALGTAEGSVVALDPTTGAILAMYSSPSFDPNGHLLQRRRTPPPRRARRWRRTSPSRT